MEPREDIAVPAGADPRRLSRALNEAHDAFVADGRASPTLRSLVRDSWRRSLSGGMDPEHGVPPISLDEEELERVRSEHPLAVAMPVIRRLLVESARESGLLVAVTDAAGRLLWVEGASLARRRAEAMAFVPGADWSEAQAGTNAPGTALALDRPVQIFGPEHLARPVTPWSCSAAPIHDPDTGAVLGILDLTGGPEVVSPQSLGLVRATAAAVEAELRITRLEAAAAHPSSPAPTESTPRLDVLGVRSATWRDAMTTTRLSLRHSELLLLLASSARGYTSAELAVELSEHEIPEVTVRAELSRLRGTLGRISLLSRPYRLAGALRTDVDALRSRLAGGRLRQAVAAYRGPILPDSRAPGVSRLRDELHELVRSSLLGSDDPDAVLSFADTPHGVDDYAMWEHAVAIVPSSSPRAAQVAAHLRRLDAELA